MLQVVAVWWRPRFQATAALWSHISLKDLPDTRYFSAHCRNTVAGDGWWFSNTWIEHRITGKSSDSLTFRTLKPNVNIGTHRNANKWNSLSTYEDTLLLDLADFSAFPVCLANARLPLEL